MRQLGSLQRYAFGRSDRRLSPHLAAGLVSFCCLILLLVLTPLAEAQGSNEAPINRLGGVTIPGSGAALTTSGNGSLTFSSNSVPGALSIADADAGTGTLITALQVSNGSLSAPNGGSIVSGNGARLQLTGTVAQINAALEGLNFTGTTNGGATLLITTNDGGNTGGPAQSTTNFLNLSVSGTSAGTSGAIVSEFRFRGSNGPTDEYVEICSTLDTPLNIGGWSIKTNIGTAANPQLQTTTVPANTLLPPRGHYLFTGGAYGLTRYGVGDASIVGDISDDSGVALYNAAFVPQVQDAVGFAASLSSLREGAGLPSAPTVDGEHAFSRAFIGQSPQNSADSSQDFVFVSTLGASVAGTNGAVISQLGAPSPQGLSSPININWGIGVTGIDPAVAITAAPNRVRVGTGNSGYLLLRRNLTNNTGRSITQMRFLVTGISSLGSPIVNTGTTQSDVRLSSTSTENVLLSSGATVPVYGTTLEANAQNPDGGPSQPLGGGLTSSLSFTAILSTPLPDGESRSYSIKVDVVRTGAFFINLNAEALPSQILPPTHGADLLIGSGAAGAGTALVGENVFSPTAQVQSVSSGSNTPAIFRLIVQNKGNASDKFRLSAPADISGWATHFFDAPSGGADVSAQVKSDGYILNLAGDAKRELRIEITPDGTVSQNQIDEVPISLVCISVPLLTDQVTARAVQTTYLPQGSFEIPVLAAASFQSSPLVGSPWSFDTKSGIASNNSGLQNGTAPQGVQVAYLKPSGAIKQSVPMQAGSYSLRFLATSRGGDRSTYSRPQSFTVKLDGVGVGQFITSNPSPANWVQVATPTFAVTAGDHEISIINNNGNPNEEHILFVDRVQLVDPTQPATSLTPPSNLRATATSGAVTLNWSPVTGATGYALQRATRAQGPWSEVQRVSGTQTTDTGLTNGTLYFYTVTSLRDRPEAATPMVPFPVDQSAPSAPVSAKPGSTLAAPGHLVAQGKVVQGMGQVLLSWEAAAGATSYEVARLEGSEWEVLTTLTGTSYIDTPLAIGVTYYYKVRSLQGASTADSDMAHVTLDNPPSAPTLTATAVTAGQAQIRLDWTAVPGAATFLVQRSTRSGGPYALIERATSSPYTDSDVKSGQVYYYVVQAVKSQNTAPSGGGDLIGAASNEAAATAQNRPVTPLQLRATPGDSKILLEWEGSTEVTGYQLWRSTNAGIWMQIATPNANIRFYLDSGLTNGVLQTYLVRAIGNSGNSGDSDTLTTRAQSVPSPKPDVLRIGLRTSTSIEVLLPTYRAALLTLDMGTEPGPDRMLPIATGLSGGSAYTVTGLSPGTVYYFACVPESGAGQGAASASTWISAKTLLQAPESPAAPHYSNVTDASLTVMPGALPIRAYSLRLQRQTGASSWQNVFEGDDGGIFGFDLSGLTPNTTYTFRLVAIGEDSETAGPSSSIKTAPFAPEIPVIEAITPTSLRVQRVASGQSVPPLPGGATSLSLQLRVSSDPNDPEWRTVATGLTTNAAYTFSGLFPRSQLTLRYVAVGTAGQTAGSPVSIQTAEDTVPPTAPTVPIKPLFAGVDINELTVTRPYASYGANWILQQKSGTTYSDIHTFAPSTQSWKVQGLNANTSYTFRFLSGTTPGPDAIVRTAPAVSSAPAVNAIHDTSVDLILPVVPTNVSLSLQYSDSTLDYSYGYGDPDFGWITAATGLSGGASATVSSLLPGSTTRFRVVAVGPDASTSSDATPDVTLLDPAPGLVATPRARAINPTTILIAAPVPPPYVKQFWMQYKEPATSTWQEILFYDASVPYASANSTSRYINQLQPATAYQVRLKVAGNNGSAYSSIATVSTPPDYPGSFSVNWESATETSVSVTVPAILPLGASSLTLQIGEYDQASESVLAWRSAVTGVVPGVTPASGVVTVGGLISGVAYGARWVSVGVTGQTPGTMQYAQTLGSASSLGAPQFADATPDSVMVWPPTLPNELDSYFSYKLQAKLLGETDFSDVSPYVPSYELSSQRVEGLTPGATYQFRYLQTDSYSPNDPENPGNTMAGAVASLTLPTPSSVTWDAGTGISCGGIRYPSDNMTIPSGQLGHLNSLTATDWDVMQSLVNGLPTRKDVTDTCSYAWSANGGSFPEGSTGSNVPWQAPVVSVPTTYTIALTVSDQASANKGAGDAGARADTTIGAADQPLRFVIRVQVLPALP